MRLIHPSALWLCVLVSASAPLFAACGSGDEVDMGHESSAGGSGGSGSGTGGSVLGTGGSGSFKALVPISNSITRL